MCGAAAAAEGAGGDVYTEGDMQRGVLRGGGTCGEARAAGEMGGEDGAGRVQAEAPGVERVQAGEYALDSVLGSWLLCGGEGRVFDVGMA